MSIGKSIRLLREALEIKQNDFAEKCDVDVGTISAIENRESSRSKYFTQIANRGFGIPTDLLETINDETAANSIALAIKAGKIPAPSNSISEALVAEPHRPYQNQTHEIASRIDKLDKKGRALVLAMLDTIESFQSDSKGMPGKQTKLSFNKGVKNGSQQRKSDQG